MRHPDEAAAARVTSPGLHHGFGVIPIMHLRLFAEFIEGTGGAVHLIDPFGIDAAARLVKVMEIPHRTDWPEVFFGHHEAHSVGRGNANDPLFAVKGFPAILKVPGVGVGLVRTTAGHQTGLGMGDVKARSIKRMCRVGHCGIQLFWRVPFIASAIKRERRMVANADDAVVRIRDEHRVVVGVGSVGRVGEPEIVPDEYAVFVAGVEELFLADLADPVADHRHVHLLMQMNGGVVVLGFITEQGVVHAPVSAVELDVLTVAGDLQDLVGGVVGKLADAEGDFTGRCGAFGGLGGEREVLQRRIAVAVGPPQRGMTQDQLREVIFVEGDLFAFVCRQLHLLHE